MEIDFFPIDIEQDFNGQSHRIAIFGRTLNGQKVCVLDEEYKAYFYIIPKDLEDIENIKSLVKDLKIHDNADSTLYAVTSVEAVEKKLLGKDVEAIKVSINDPQGIKKVSDTVRRMQGVKTTLETDIPFTRRYAIDKNITPLIACKVNGEEVKEKFDVDLALKMSSIEQKGDALIKDPKMLAFDIEVYNERRYPDENRDPIVSVAFYGSDGFSRVLTWKKFSNPKKYIEFVDGEGELLVRFKEIIQEYKPDYLVGYFSDGFDFPYLRARADKFRVKLSLGLDKSEMNLIRRSGNFSAKIRGIAHIDIYKFIRRVMGDILDVESFDLDNVAKALLGEGKHDIDIGLLADAWNNDNEKMRDYCEYNLNDSKITLRLANLMLPNINEIVKFVGQPIYDISRMTYGQLVEWYLIKHLQQFNELIPKRPSRQETIMRRIQTYEGAFVYEPEPGLYDNIVVFDFRSLYPSIISAHNICPSTLTSSSENAHASPEIEVNGEKKSYYFTYKYDGFVPTIVRDIIQRRMRIKELIRSSTEKVDPVLNARQNALKLLSNSFYGYLGFPGARWYCKECAASIAAYGRDYIKKVIGEACNDSFKVIYADTDSIFLALQNKTRNDAEEFLKKINSSLPSLMELEFQGFYPRGIFVMKKGERKGAKKKYALIDEKGKIKIIGFETIRGDWSYIAKEVQNHVFELIMKDMDVTAAVSYVNDIIKKIGKKEIPVEKMIIQKQLRKDIHDYDSIGPHVTAAQRMRDIGMFVGPGSVIQYVIEEGKGPLRERSRLPSESKSYDSEYYVTNQIIPAVEKIFEVLGCSKDIFLNQEQKSLGEF